MIWAAKSQHSGGELNCTVFNGSALILLWQQSHLIALQCTAWFKQSRCNHHQLRRINNDLPTSFSSQLNKKIFFFGYPPPNRHWHITLWILCYIVNQFIMVTDSSLICSRLIVSFAHCLIIWLARHNILLSHGLFVSFPYWPLILFAPLLIIWLVQGHIIV
jgi:hypothetical protein